MPNSCGLYNQNGCTEPCQQCYEGVIAGVMEYACYGQCVVVDAYGHRHLGPGEGAPAGWIPSAGGSMAEMIADEIANINNSEQKPTQEVDRLTQTTEEEQKAALIVARKAANFTNPTNIAYKSRDYNNVLNQARNSANFDSKFATAQFQTPPAPVGPDCCHRKPRCGGVPRQVCYKNQTTKVCMCVDPTILPTNPLGPDWLPFD